MTQYLVGYMAQLEDSLPKAVVPNALPSMALDVEASPLRGQEGASAIPRGWQGPLPEH